MVWRVLVLAAPWLVTFSVQGDWKLAVDNPTWWSSEVKALLLLVTSELVFGKVLLSVSVLSLHWRGTVCLSPWSFKDILSSLCTVFCHPGHVAFPGSRLASFWSNSSLCWIYIPVWRGLPLFPADASFQDQHCPVSTGSVLPLAHSTVALLFLNCCLSSALIAFC